LGITGSPSGRLVDDQNYEEFLLEFLGDWLPANRHLYSLVS